MNLMKDKLCSGFEKRITNPIENKNFYIFFLLKLMHEFNRAIKVNRAIRQYNLKRISELIIQNYKSSDTLFIMGSGSSINKITEEQWDEINENDSMGINFWLIHDFVPTYYMFELSSKLERESVLIDLLNKKSSDYKNTLFIIRQIDQIFKKTKKKELDFYSLPESIRNNIFIPYEFDIPSINKDNLEKSIQLINKCKINTVKNLLLSKRASLSEAICFGFKMGYKKIILCGVDLNNTKYFYEENSYYKNKLPIPPNNQNSATHKTLDPNHGSVTIDCVISKINDFLLKPNGINLYIGSKQSALYGMLPFYFEEQN